MSRKDYELIARAMREQLEGMSASLPTAFLEQFAKRLADKLARDNPRFNRERFLIACGFGSV